MWRYVAISGMMCSGKTTLSRGLARELDFLHLPKNTPGAAFLDDLFERPPRWAFDTQMAFLVSKAVEIGDAIARGESFVLDRSLDEDINIFAEYFMKQGDIDSRSSGTYMELANYFTETLPRPTVMVYCECGLEETKRRLSRSRKPHHRLYPEGHIEDILGRYDEWVNALDPLRLLKVDTLRVDTRRPAALRQVARRLWAMLPELAGERQLPLFANNVSTRKQGRRRKGRSRRALASREWRFPTAYVAAPFTSAALEAEGEQGALFQERSGHGIIPEGRYRKMLLEIDAALTAVGVSCFIPHRDINKWGHRKLIPSEIADLCTDAVQRADLVICIAGMSPGAHFELGLALGLGKPVILIICAEVPTSYLGAGFRYLQSQLLMVDAHKFEDVPGVLKSGQVLRFISRQVPVRSSLSFGGDNETAG